MLDEARIRQLYLESFKAADMWPDWRVRYEAFLGHITGVSDSDIREPAMQEELWRAREITSVGPGESVDVRGAYGDLEIVDALVSFRTREWPEDEQKRAIALQARYDHILELMTARAHSPRRPQARLARVFAALMPGQFHCVFNAPGMRHVCNLVLGARHPDGFIAEHVLVRARLRRILGPEESLSESVRRSMFCWWLHEQHDALESGATLGDARPGDAEPGELALWPFNKQSRGLAAFSRLSDAFKDVVRETVNGVDRKELHERLGSEPNFANLALNSRRLLVSCVRSVGLIELRHDLLVPTEAGEDFLANDEPDALVQLVLVRYFPFAHLLRLLAKASLTNSELYAGLQAIYPQWTSTLGPAQALAWARDLGLVESREGRNSLTAYGAAWHDRLPTDLPRPSPKEMIRAELVAPASATLSPEDAAAKAPDLTRLLELFRVDPEAKKLFFTDEQIAALHNAWHCLPGKHFAILSGLSGTGKTAIVRTYARLYLEAMGLDPEEHVKLVAVAPDWRDPSGLLGYLNPLHAEATYEVKPALELLLRACQALHLPFFLILDEMNLASIERYFAPLLSAMETQSTIDLHSHATDVNGVPASIPWPEKLFIAGTVNMDETTHVISDKVLDRAFTLEFWEVDLKRHFEKREARDELVEKLLLELNEILRPVRRHFGYRTANEVLAFAAGANDAMRRQMLDQAVYSKVLPRLRGEDHPDLKKALDAAAVCCEREKLDRSAGKLKSMRSQLEETGLMRFWS